MQTIKIKPAAGLRTVTFTQHRGDLVSTQTLQEALCPVGEIVEYRGRSMHVTGWASKFLFEANQLSTYVGNLSGGEQARLLIARLMLEPADVLLLAAGDATQIQTILQAYPDLNLVDYFDARLATPSLAELLTYDTVIVISNSSFADPVGVGDVLADYVDAGGTVIQTVPTFYDPGGSGWGLQGRFVTDGYSPFIGTGDWFRISGRAAVSRWSGTATRTRSHPAAVSRLI